MSHHAWKCSEISEKVDRQTSVCCRYPILCVASVFLFWAFCFWRAAVSRSAWQRGCRSYPRRCSRDGAKDGVQASRIPRSGCGLCIRKIPGERSFGSNSRSAKSKIFSGSTFGFRNAGWPETFDSWESFILDSHHRRKSSLLSASARRSLQDPARRLRLFRATGFQGRSRKKGRLLPASFFD